MQTNNEPWSLLCHACTAQVPAGAHTCTVCGAVVPTIHEDLRMANHPFILEFKRNRQLILGFALALIVLMLMVILFRLGYEWRRGRTPDLAERIPNEGYYWIIGSAIVGIGSQVAIYFLHRRLERKWRHSGIVPKPRTAKSNPPATILALGILIVALAGLFLAGLIQEVMTIEHPRATKELLPGIVASVLVVAVSVVMSVLSFRNLRSSKPLTGDQLTNSKDNE